MKGKGVRKKKVSFRSPEYLIDRILDLKERKGLEDATEAFNYILKAYFDQADAEKQGSKGLKGNSSLSSIVEELDILRRENRDLIKMLLIIGTANSQTSEAFMKHFPQYFK
jgi:hypothetical protein